MSEREAINHNREAQFALRTRQSQIRSETVERRLEEVKESLLRRQKANERFNWLKANFNKFRWRELSFLYEPSFFRWRTSQYLAMATQIAKSLRSVAFHARQAARNLRISARPHNAERNEEDSTTAAPKDSGPLNQFGRNRRRVAFAYRLTRGRGPTPVDRAACHPRDSSTAESHAAARSLRRDRPLSRLPGQV